jgi:hypothetical protein
MEINTMKENLSVREIQEKVITSLVNYWFDSSGEYLTGLGVDLNKIPSRKDLAHALKRQISACPKIASLLF